MKILVINCGSSSIRYRLFDNAGWRVLAGGILTRIGEPRGEFVQTPAAGAEGSRETVRVRNHRQGMGRIMDALTSAKVLDHAGELAAVGHRVVHGGDSFHRPALIDGAVLDAIRDTLALAPLHNGPNLQGIEVARELFPGSPQVAVFDTAFHQTMPPAAYRYALPDELYREQRVRRYGFHGTSHHYVAGRAATFLDRPLEACNLITLHLGNGASATAIENGCSVDTSMGLTPLEGLVMGTRCGDIDPAIHFYLYRQLGLDADALEDMLNRRSGLLGICGVNDMREIEARATAGDDRARLAVDMFCHRLKKYIGAYLAVLGRVDALVFTGGIGENDSQVRARSCSGLEGMGIEIDAQANRAPQAGERCISTTASRIAVLVIPTDEELEIARQTVETIA